MDFHDLTKYKISLLAKQGQRILTNPTSLVGRILKAKYFSYSDFFGVQLSSNPSLIWRRIYSSRKLLELRLKWKVGLGRLISVWNDKWLLGSGIGRFFLLGWILSLGFWIFSCPDVCCGMSNLLIQCLMRK